MYKRRLFSQASNRFQQGFTLLELLIVLTVVAVLAVLVIATTSQLRARAQRVQCTANLRSLYVAANLYVQQNGSWPQIGMGSDSDTDEQDYATAWIAALKPFGISQTTWICPTIQNLLGNADYLRPESARVDYMATPFDDKPTTPTTWPTQPWFIETGDVHGHGNLIVFTDGSASDLKTVVKERVAK